MSPVAQIDSRWEVLSDQLVIGCCIDRLSRQAFSGVESYFSTPLMTDHSTRASIEKHVEDVEALVSRSPIPRVRQFRCTPSSSGRLNQAPRPAIGPSAPSLLHELQLPILRLSD